MLGTEHRIPKRRAHRNLAPQNPFSPGPGSMPRCAPQPLLLFRTGPPLVTAFRSPTTALAFASPIPGSMFPACYFATLANRFHRPFGLQLHPEARFASTPRGFLAENPLPLPRSTPRAAPPASTPLWDFYLPKDQSVPLVGCPAAYLPAPPDLRSLPEALNYFTSTGPRIIVPGPLRFRRLAVPQTSWNLP